MEKGATAATPPTRACSSLPPSAGRGQAAGRPGLRLAEPLATRPSAITPTAGGPDRWERSAGGLTAGGSGGARHASAYAHDRSARRVLSLSVVAAAVTSKWVPRRPTLGDTTGAGAPLPQCASAATRMAGRPRVGRCRAFRRPLDGGGGGSARRRRHCCCRPEEGEGAAASRRQRGDAADRLVADSCGGHVHHPRCGGNGRRVGRGGRWPCLPPPPPPRGRGRRGRRAAPPPPPPPPSHDHGRRRPPGCSCGRAGHPARTAGGAPPLSRGRPPPPWLFDVSQPPATSLRVDCMRDRGAGGRGGSRGVGD